MAMPRKPGKPATSKPAVKKHTAKTATARKSVAKKAAAKKPVAKKVAAKKPVAKKVIAKKPVAKHATAKKIVKKAVARKTIAKRPAAKKVVSKQAVAKKPVAKKSVRTRKPRMITPEQALANTRALLQAKQAQTHQPPPYPTDDPVHQGHPGFMSNSAAEAAHERHLGEINNDAIHGHIAAQVRQDQAKRDGRS